MLTIADLQVSYGRSRVISGLSLELGSGELVSLLGRNGVGKTTLLKSIIGLLKPAAGSIRLEGENLEKLPAHLIARRGIAYAPQDNQLFPTLSVRDNIFIAIRDKSLFDERIDNIFSYFPILKEKFAQPGGSLSGGQQKFVAIARALIAKPRLLLLDEPSEGIQPSIVLQLAEIIKKIVERESCSLLLVEQNRKMALRAAKRGYVMDRGGIVAEGELAVLEQEGLISQYMTF